MHHRLSVSGGFHSAVSACRYEEERFKKESLRWELRLPLLFLRKVYRRVNAELGNNIQARRARRRGIYYYEKNTV